MEENIWEIIKSHFFSFINDMGPSLIYAGVGFVIGIFVIKILMGFLRRLLMRSHLDISLKSFIESLSIFLLNGFLLFIIGLILGIKVSSFLAIFGAAGIALGLALQGSLTNFAGGILILVFKPFRVGDSVFINNNLGVVKTINILYTHLKTADGRIIAIPNGILSNSEIDNRSKEKYRRLELKLNFSFEEDVEHLREIITRAMKKHPKVVKNKPIQVWLNEIGDYDMKITARCWATSDYYWDLYWAQMEAVKKEIEMEGISFSIPQRVVHKPKVYKG